MNLELKHFDGHCSEKLDTNFSKKRDISEKNFSLRTSRNYFAALKKNNFQDNIFYSGFHHTILIYGVNKSVSVPDSLWHAPAISRTIVLSFFFVSIDSGL